MAYCVLVLRLKLNFFFPGFGKKRNSFIRAFFESPACKSEGWHCSDERGYIWVPGAQPRASVAERALPLPGRSTPLSLSYKGD